MPQVRPLIIRFGAMGDMILLTGLMQALQRRFGLPCDVLSSGGWTRPLLQGNEDLATLHLLTSRNRPYLLAPEQWALVSLLRQRPRGPIYVCDLYSQDKVRWLLMRAGVDPADCLFLRTDMFPLHEHWFDVWKMFSERAPENYSTFPVLEGNYPPFPKLSVSDAAAEDVQAFLLDNHLSGPLVLLQPGNKRTLKRGRLGAIGDHKSWPTTHWIALCHGLLAERPELRILLCGASPEQALLSDIATGTGSERVHALGDQLPIPRLMALLQRAQSLVSIDSGPAHAAAALGCPTVVLFGQTELTSWLPRGPAGTSVIGLEAPAGQPRRVDQITVDRVLAAWRALGQRPLPAPLVRLSSDSANNQCVH